MPMTSQVAVARITRELKALENALDLALAKKSTLVAEFTRARIDLELDAHSGQVALMRLAKAEHSLISARGNTIRAHEDLYRLGVERGDIADGKPPSGSLDRFEEETALSKVA